MDERDTIEHLLTLQIEEGVSDKSWADVDKSKLPKSAFLWIEGDGKTKDLWHLPYKDEAGNVNLGALRAIAAAIAGARTGKPMSIPADVRKKIDDLLKKHKIGQYAKKQKLHLFRPFGLGMRYREISEQLSNPMADVKEENIDPENYMIKNVCIFGKRESDNGYVYTDKAIDSLVRLSQGVKCFLNHPSKSETKDRDGVRDLKDWVGVYDSPRKNGDKIHADLFVREAYWDLVQDIALMQPAKVGNSVNSRVRVFVDDKGKESIVDVDKLHSVDLVASGATIDNLWESTDEKLDEEDVELAEQLSSILEEYFPRLIGDIKEGILSDKIKQDEIRSKASSLMWKANDMIYDLMRDKNGEFKTFSEKRKQINNVLDDLEKELGKILPKVKPEEGGKPELAQLADQPVVVFPSVVLPD